MIPAQAILPLPQKSQNHGDHREDCSSHERARLPGVDKSRRAELSGQRVCVRSRVLIVSHSYPKFTVRSSQFVVHSSHQQNFVILSGVCRVLCGKRNRRTRGCFSPASNSPPQFPSPLRSRFTSPSAPITFFLPPAEPSPESKS